MSHISDVQWVSSIMHSEVRFTTRNEWLLERAGLMETMNWSFFLPKPSYDYYREVVVAVFTHFLSSHNFAAKTSTCTTSGLPSNNSSTLANNASATFPCKCFFLPSSEVRKSMIPNSFVPGNWIANHTGVKVSAWTRGRAPCKCVSAVSLHAL